MFRCFKKHWFILWGPFHDTGKGSKESFSFQFLRKHKIALKVQMSHEYETKSAKFRVLLTVWGLASHCGPWIEAKRDI